MKELELALLAQGSHTLWKTQGKGLFLENQGNLREFVEPSGNFGNKQNLREFSGNFRLWQDSVPKSRYFFVGGKHGHCMNSLWMNS